MENKWRQKKNEMRRRREKNAETILPKPHIQNTKYTIHNFVYEEDRHKSKFTRFPLNNVHSHTYTNTTRDNNETTLGLLRVYLMTSWNDSPVRWIWRKQANKEKHKRRAKHHYRSVILWHTYSHESVAFIRRINRSHFERLTFGSHSQ